MISGPRFNSLIMLSRKPVAKKLKRWITHDFLPAIRKTSRYVKNEMPKLDTDRD